MGREVRDKRELYTPKPVEKVNVSGNKPKLRLALAVILGLFGIGMIAYGLYSHLEAVDGWQEISVSSSAGVSCGDEFIFQYYLGAGELSATAEKKLLTKYYSDLCVQAYKLFNAGESFDGLTNICYINEHPNEEIEVDPALYHALEKLEKSGTRLIYMAPVYEQYQTLFFCNEDSQTAEFDPFQNKEAAEWYKEVASFAADDEQIQLELLGENRVRLYMSDMLLQYSEDNEVSSWLDLFWLKNAVIADYLADALTENGYVYGSLSSYDGFIRNLDSSDNSYEFALYNRNGNTIEKKGVLHYSGAISLVHFRDYPLNSLDFQRYYELKNSEIRFAYIDTKDGLCRSAVHNLTVVSRQEDCTDLAVKAAKVYIADSLDATVLEQPEYEKMDFVYFEDSAAKILHNNCGLKIEQ